MTETSDSPTSGQSMKQYYVLGVVVLAAIIIAGYLLKPKTSPTSTKSPIVEAQPTATPTPGPITGLICDTKYYNPVIGFPKYYVSVEGGDVSTAKKVDCEFDITVDGKTIATDTVSSPLTDKPQRGGSTFRCTTKALEITPGVPATVTIQLKDDLKATASCSAAFLFPAP